MNAAPDERTPRWSLSAEPLLTIGREGDSLYEFFRPQQALTLTGGRIAVSNAFREIRYFDSTGTYLLTAGRKGYGPGEFTHLMWIERLPGDSLAALENRDGVYQEMYVFDPRGRLARSYRFQLGGSGRRTRSGAWVGAAADVERTSCSPTPTRHRVDQVLVRATPNGKVARRLTRLLAGHGVRMGCTSFHVPLTPQGEWAVGADHLFTTEADSHIIRVHSLADGRVERTIRTSAPVRRVTPPMIEDALNPPPPPGPRLPREPGAANRRPPMKYPEVLPAIASMRTDAAGNLWVRRYFLWTDPEHEWWIYDSTGSLRATLRSTARFRFTEIGEDHVLGIWRDADDVETVRRFGLVKPPT